MGNYRVAPKQTFLICIRINFSRFWSHWPEARVKGNDPGPLPFVTGVLPRRTSGAYQTARHASVTVFFLSNFTNEENRLVYAYCMNISST